MRRWGAVALATLVVAGGTAGGLVISGNQTAGACDYPSCFPDTSNTGVTDEGALTTVSSNVTLSTNGQTYQDKIVNGCITVTGSGVTIRNVRVTCTSTTPINYSDTVGYDDTPLLIEDTEIDCDIRAGSHGFEEGNATLRRVEIRECENGLSVNQNTLIEDSLIHQLSDEGSDPHEDGIQVGCGHYTGNLADNPGLGCDPDGVLDGYLVGSKNITVRHNKIEGVTVADGDATSAIILNKQGTGPDEDILIEENWLHRGGVTIYCTRTDDGGTTQTGINEQIINNHFTQRTPPTTFYSTECSDEAATSGNVRHDTGDPIVLD
jgi:hypothetical protein